jgi:iron(III) transport system permease protein
VAAIPATDQMNIGRRPSLIRRVFSNPGLLSVLAIIVVLIVIAIIMPLFAMIGESFSEEGRVLFKDYLESPVYQKIIQNTIVMGLAVASIGTVVGFFLAYVQVKVKVPFKRFMHIIALVPIISPPFAVATATLILFGRSGIITYRLFDIRYNIYGIKAPAPAGRSDPRTSRPPDGRSVA